MRTSGAVGGTDRLTVERIVFRLTDPAGAGHPKGRLVAQYERLIA